MNQYCIHTSICDRIYHTFRLLTGPLTKRVFDNVPLFLLDSRNNKTHYIL